MDARLSTGYADTAIQAIVGQRRFGDRGVLFGNQSRRTPREYAGEALRERASGEAASPIEILRGPP